MLNRKQCSNGHNTAQAQKICLSCGYIFPVEIGAELQGCPVLAQSTHFQRNIYLLQGQDQNYTVVELLDYFAPDVRQRLILLLQPLLESLGMPLLRWEVHHEDGLPVLYSYYPEDLWQIFQAPVQSQLELQGLLVSEQIVNLLLYYQKVQQGLARLNLCNPGLILPLLFSHQGRHAFLEWEFTVPIDDSVIYPLFYIGYHPMAVSARVNRNYAQQAFYASVTQLIVGKSPAFWYPQQIDWKPYRSVLQTETIDLLQNLHHTDFQDLLKQKIYNPSLQASLREANQQFYQGIYQWENRKVEEARSYFEAASLAYLNCPQIFKYLSFSLRSLGEASLALQVIKQAIRIQPLASLYYEQSLLLIHQNQLDQAVDSLTKATQTVPNYPEAWFELGKLFYKLGMLSKAETAYKNAWSLRQSSDYAKALYLFYQNKNLPREAEKYAVGKTNSGALFQKRVQTFSQKSLEFEGVWNYCRKCQQANDQRALNCQFCQHPLYLQKGDILASDYHIIGVIQLKDYSKSHYTNIYLAHYKNQTVVLKELILSHAHLRLFEREKRIMSAFQHPNTVSLLGSFQIDDTGYLVYQYIDGQTLQEYLKLNGYIDEALAIKIAYDLGNVLSAMQAQKPPLVHGDIKPSNILIARDGQLYLLDFESSLSLGGLPGIASTVSPGFSPPEQYLFYHLNLSSDSYALARTLVYSLTGLPVELSEEHYLFTQTHRWQHFAPQLHAQLIAFLKSSLLVSVKDRLSPEKEIYSKYLNDLKLTQASATPEKTKKITAFLQDMALASDPFEQFKLALSILTQDSSTITLTIAASAAMATNAHRKAYRMLTRIQQIDPSYLPATWLLAECYQALGLIREGLQFLIRSNEKYPHVYRNYELLGEFYSRAKEPINAIKAFEKAKFLRPPLCEIDYTLASLYSASGFYDKAIDHCRKWLAIEQPIEKKVKLLHVLGASLGSKGFFESALDPLEKAYQYLPGEYDIIYDLALTHYMLKNYQRALGLFQLRLKKGDIHPPSLYHLALVAIELKQGELAIRALQQFESDSFNEAEYYFHLARAYTLISDVKQAYHYYQIAYQLMPDSVGVLVNLANLLVIMEQPQAAVPLLVKAIRLNPALKEASHTLSLIRQKAS